MKFPEDAPVTQEKRSWLRERLGLLKIDLAQVEEDATRGRGPGGQKVNKTWSGVLLRYRLNEEQILVKWTSERQHGLNRFLALRELCEQVAQRIAPELSIRKAEEDRRRKQKDRRRRRQKDLPSVPQDNPTITDGPDLVTSNKNAT